RRDGPVLLDGLPEQEQVAARQVFPIAAELTPSPPYRGPRAVASQGSFFGQSAGSFPPSPGWHVPFPQCTRASVFVCQLMQVGTQRPDTEGYPVRPAGARLRTQSGVPCPAPQNAKMLEKMENVGHVVGRFRGKTGQPPPTRAAGESTPDKAKI